MKLNNQIVGKGIARTRMRFGRWYIQLLDANYEIDYEDGPMSYKEAWTEQQRFIGLGYMKEY